jgi:uncharacterized protein involved in exopolysaccharide biosynthesis
MSLLALANVVLRHRWTVVRVAAVVTLAALAYLLLRPREYTSSATFRLQTRTSPGEGLSSFAAQLGLPLSLTDASQTPAFYVDLLRSREILGSAVTHQYPATKLPPGQTTDLVKGLKVRGKNPEIRRERAMEKLLDVMTVLASPRTGVISLSVTLKDPVLAQAVALHLIDRINVFNLESRQSQAGAERRFVERRLDEVRRDLRSAEDRVQAFLQRNRDYRNSPELTFQQERLARDVSLQQTVFSTLAQSYEQAKIEEVRDTPTLTLIDHPERPPLPDRRGLAKKGLLAVILGGLLGLGIALVREGFGRAHGAGSEELREFHALRRATFDQLRPWRRRSTTVEG